MALGTLQQLPLGKVLERRIPCRQSRRQHRSSCFLCTYRRTDDVEMTGRADISGVHPCCVSQFDSDCHQRFIKPLMRLASLSSELFVARLKASHRPDGVTSTD